MATEVVIPLNIKNKNIKLYIEKYSDANFTHFCKIIEENIISLKARKILENTPKAQLKNIDLKKFRIISLLRKILFLNISSAIIWVK